MAFDTKFKVASLNVRGLRDKSKRSILGQWFIENKIDIIFLQETYCSKSFKHKFRREWAGLACKIKHCYTDSAHSRGVCMIFRKDLDVHFQSKHASRDGRTLVINCKINEFCCSLMNIYAPNTINDRKAYFLEISELIKTHIIQDT